MRLVSWVCGEGEDRVLCRWRCSLWKLIWRELLGYTATYLLISVLYRMALGPHHQVRTELFCFMDTFSLQEVMGALILWCREQLSNLPLTFLLGFYVTVVIRRWWDQYEGLPYPETVCIFLQVRLPRW